MASFSNWFITTSAIENCSIFISKRDFVNASNDLALCTLDFPNVRVLFYVIMCNHIHIILRGDRQECIAFVRKYLWRVSIRLREKGEAQIVSNIDLDVAELPDQASLLNAGAYIIRNPYAATIHIDGRIFNPFTYPWSSAMCYFNAMSPHSSIMCQPDSDDEGVGLKVKHFIRLDEISVRKSHLILKTNMSLPGDWIIDGNGMIHPSCFVDYRYVEDEIQFPGRLLGAVSSNRIEAEVESRFGNFDKVVLSESEISAIILKEAKDKFYVSSIRQVPQRDLLLMCGRYHRSHHIGAKTLARITGLPLTLIEKVCL